MLQKSLDFAINNAFIGKSLPPDLVTSLTLVETFLTAQTQKAVVLQLLEKDLLFRKCVMSCVCCMLEKFYVYDLFCVIVQISLFVI